ncbi:MULTISPECIES: alpha/beta hydrolase [Streptomyces]|uniref:alpha/beta hydrolase n=1 Tax=Streptomyces TaxID=1883 RepID=UPI00186AEBDC|nr:MULTISPECIES: alpha/beta hydrolase [Streptomyces]
MWGALGLAAFTAALAVLAAALVLLPAPSWTAWQLGLLVLEFSLLLAVPCALGAALAWGVRRRARRTALALLAVNALAIPAAALPPAAGWWAAREAGVPVSLGDYLTGGLAVSADREPETVRYAAPEGEELYLDVWQPADHDERAAPLPVVLNIHGGAEDEPQSLLPRWDAWLADQGYLVLDVDYRFFPPGRWWVPAADVRCAVDWARTNAERWGGDPERIALMGQSAGGLIALQSAYVDGELPESGCPGGATEGDGSEDSGSGGDGSGGDGSGGDGSGGDGSGGDGAPAVDAVIAWYAVTDLTSDAPPFPWRLRHSPIGDELAASNEEMLGGTEDEVPQAYRDASPLRQVRPGLPPTLLIQGGWDMLNSPADNRRFAAELDRAGVPHQLVETPAAEHMFDLNWGGFGSQLARAEIIRFLADQL